MYKVATLAVAAGALMVLYGWSAPAAAQSAEEEVAKQTARLISDAIAKRVGDDVDVIYAAPGSQGMVAESADMLNTVWGTLTYNRVDFDGGFGGSSGVDIFLGTVGFDHRFDNFIPGISVTGAYANVDQTTGSSLGATVSPYLGYIVNDWFFLNGLVGVSMSNADIGGGDSDSLGVFTEEDANAVWHSGNWLAPGRPGTASGTRGTMRTASVPPIPMPIPCWPAARSATRSIRCGLMSAPSTSTISTWTHRTTISST
jgi:hypothetical protein